MAQPGIYRAACVVALLAAGVALAQGAQQTRVQQEEACARNELAKMSNFLARQQRFTFKAQRSSEVMNQGKRVTLKGTSQVAMERPNKLRVDREGDFGSGSAYYDGKQLSVMAKGANVYASTPAPPTIDAMLDQAEDALGWIPPGADLLSNRPDKVMETNVTSGRCLPDGRVGNTPVKRLAFVGPDATWEISIEDSQTPVPRELVIVPKNDPQELRYALELSDWKLSPKLDPALFTFVPPKGSQRVAFLRAPPQPGTKAPAAQGRRGKQP